MQLSIKRVKLAGSAALFLGAIPSISLTSIDLSSLSIDNLFISSGGAKTTRSLEADWDSVQKMNVGDKLKQFKDLTQKEIASPELSEVREFIDFSNQEKINESDSGNTIKTTFGEIDREGKAIAIKEDSEKKTAEATKKSVKHIGNYLSAKRKLDAFFTKQQSSPAPRRTKRSAPIVVDTKLSVEERKSLLEMYKLFDNLSIEKSNLAPKLKEILENEAIAVAVQALPRSNEIESQLRQIDWTTKSDVRYTTETAQSYGKKKKPNVWEDWNKNPYRKFLLQKEKYDDLMKTLKNSESALNKYLASNRLKGVLSILGGPPGVRSAYSGQNQFNAKVGDAKSAFANHVALQMLTWMGQHKNTMKLS